MKRKLTSKTYLRDVEKYIIKFDFSNDEYYVVTKKMLKCEQFIVEKRLKLMDNNYYMIEIIPKYENYTIRVFLNENKKILAYYFDITLKNGLDHETKIPFYDDLFLDITMIGEKIKLLDEDELLEAYENKIITKDQMELAYKTASKLTDELKNKTNRFVNMELKNLLKDM